MCESCSANIDGNRSFIAHVQSSAGSRMPRAYQIFYLEKFTHCHMVTIFQEFLLLLAKLLVYDSDWT